MRKSVVEQKFQYQTLKPTHTPTQRIALGVPFKSRANSSRDAKLQVGPANAASPLAPEAKELERPLKNVMQRDHEGGEMYSEDYRRKDRKCSCSTTRSMFLNLLSRFHWLQETHRRGNNEIVSSRGCSSLLAARWVDTKSPQ